MPHCRLSWCSMAATFSSSRHVGSSLLQPCSVFIWNPVVACCAHPVQLLGLVVLLPAARSQLRVIGKPRCMIDCMLICGLRHSIPDCLTLGCSHAINPIFLLQYYIFCRCCCWCCCCCYGIKMAFHKCEYFLFIINTTYFVVAAVGVAAAAAAMVSKWLFTSVNIFFL